MTVSGGKVATCSVFLCFQVLLKPRCCNQSVVPRSWWKKKLQWSKMPINLETFLCFPTPFRYDFQLSTGITLRLRTWATRDCATQPVSNKPTTSYIKGLLHWSFQWLIAILRQLGSMIPYINHKSTRVVSLLTSFQSDNERVGRGGILDKLLVMC